MPTGLLHEKQLNSLGSALYRFVKIYRPFIDKHSSVFGYLQYVFN